MRKPVTVVGAGIRGQQYARMAVAGGRGWVVAVAEPMPARREQTAREYSLPPEAGARRLAGTGGPWPACRRGGGRKA